MERHSQEFAHRFGGPATNSEVASLGVEASFAGYRQLLRWASQITPERNTSLGVIGVFLEVFEWGTSGVLRGFLYLFEGKLFMALILWVIAVVLVLSGIAALLRKQMLYGVVLIVVGLLVGPGGVSLFT